MNQIQEDYIRALAMLTDGVKLEQNQTLSALIAFVAVILEYGYPDEETRQKAAAIMGRFLLAPTKESIDLP